MTIKIFGQLNDIVGGNAIDFENASDTDELNQQLQSRYPALKNSKYKIAVNRDIIQVNTAIQPNTEIALLPPFSGG